MSRHVLERPTLTELLQAALDYRSWGFSVIPLKRNKRPLGRWKRWQHERPTDRQIGRLWASNAIYGVGVVLGPVSSRLAVRDFDVEEDYEKWASSHPDLADVMPTVRTARGYHVYHRLIGPESNCNVKGRGEYHSSSRFFSVLPPSLHPLWLRYEWVGRLPTGIDSFPLFTLEDTHLYPYPIKEAGRPQQRTRIINNLLCPLTDSPSGSSDRLGSLPPAVREAVLRTLPGGVGERHHSIFQLAAALYDIAPSVGGEYWYSAFSAWHGEAESVIRTTDFAFNWREFQYAWEQIEYPRSEQLPLRLFRTAVESAGGDDMERLVAGCRELAAITTSSTFYLSCRSVADALGCGKSWAAKLLKRAVADGLLEIVEAGERSARNRRATVYRLGSPD